MIQPIRIDVPAATSTSRIKCAPESTLDKPISTEIAVAAIPSGGKIYQKLIAMMKALAVWRLGRLCRTVFLSNTEGMP